MDSEQKHKLHVAEVMVCYGEYMNKTEAVVFDAQTVRQFSTQGNAEQTLTYGTVV